ncbi:unnamed protein product [Adineta ricciae]|uniref:Uncharacterized protein n=1 Tax=Adineta ricciae TaxID=249248 RepID=A0A813Y345_ADIRI|nr:unnamed protein product [Adineta ricciae]CAF1561070.1 unnamed protein product [Adineta ricciae]
MQSSITYCLAFCVLIIFAAYQANADVHIGGPGLSSIHVNTGGPQMANTGINVHLSSKKKRDVSNIPLQRQRRVGIVQTSVCGNGVITMKNGRIVCELQ